MAHPSALNARKSLIFETFVVFLSILCIICLMLSPPPCSQTGRSDPVWIQTTLTKWKRKLKQCISSSTFNYVALQSWKTVDQCKTWNQNKNKLFQWNARMVGQTEREPSQETTYESRQLQFNHHRKHFVRRRSPVLQHLQLATSNGGPTQRSWSCSSTPVLSALGKHWGDINLNS